MKYIKLFKSKRFFLVVLFIFVYILGSHIPLPIAETLKEDSLGDFFKGKEILIGIDLSSYNIFSLGLSPWITSQILFRVFTMFSRNSENRKSPISLDHKIKINISIIIALIQSTGIILMSVQNVHFEMHHIYIYIASICITITGSVLLSWISSMNIRYGFGGQSTIILFTLTSGIFKRIKKINTNKIELNELIILFFISLFFIVVTLIIQKSEYRFPMKKLSVRYLSNSSMYVPIPLNPSGGMPFFYSSLLSIMFGFIIVNINKIFGFKLYLYKSDLFMVIYNLIAIFLLTYAFSIFNLNIDKITDRMRKSGDYLINTPYGKSTEKKFYRGLTIVVFFEAVYNIFVVFMPNLITMIDENLKNYGSLFQTFAIAINMFLYVIADVKIFFLIDRLKNNKWNII